VCFLDHRRVGGGMRRYNCDETLAGDGLGFK
jgi:hypothetical protein